MRILTSTPILPSLPDYEQTPATVTLTPLTLDAFINLDNYFNVVWSTDEETGFTFRIIWDKTRPFQDNRFHEQGKLSELHNPDGSVDQGGLARAIQENLFQVIEERFDGMITVLDAGRVLAERPRTDSRTGQEILDNNQFRGNYVQIPVSQVSELVAVVRPIAEGRHSGAARDQRRDVQLADGRVLVLDGLYGVETHPTFSGLFAIPDPDNEEKFIVIMFQNSGDMTAVSSPHAMNAIARLHNILSWVVNTPEAIQDKHGLRSIVIREINPDYDYLISEAEWVSFMNNRIPLLAPITSNN